MGDLKSGQCILGSQESYTFLPPCTQILIVSKKSKQILRRVGSLRVCSKYMGSCKYQLES